MEVAARRECHRAEVRGPQFVNFGTVEVAQIASAGARRNSRSPMLADQFLGAGPKLLGIVSQAIVADLGWQSKLRRPGRSAVAPARHTADLGSRSSRLESHHEQPSSTSIWPIAPANVIPVPLATVKSSPRNRTDAAAGRCLDVFDAPPLAKMTAACAASCSAIFSTCRRSLADRFFVPVECHRGSTSCRSCAILPARSCRSIEHSLNRGQVRKSATCAASGRR